jgi:hypothetical protein
VAQRPVDPPPVPEDLIDRLRPFLEAELAAGRIDWLPTDDEMRALLPVVQERLPTCPRSAS